MIKRYFNQQDYLEENKAKHFPTCLYCGSILSEHKTEYCSMHCRKKDAVWHSEDSAV